MTAKAILYTPAAGKDLDAILDYLDREAGRNVAERYTLRFRSAIARLAELPFTGARRPELGQGMRYWIVDPYLILYEATDAGLTILRIVHGKRNLTSDLFEP